MPKTLTKADLINKFSEALGREKAVLLIAEALDQSQLGNKNAFNREDVMQIANVLKQKGGFIGIIASCLVSEAYRLK